MQPQLLIEYHHGMGASVLVASALVLYAAIAAVLIHKYRRTHDAGFIWLGIALIGWPLISSLIERGERISIDRLVQHQPIASWPFTLVERGTTTLGSLVTELAAGRRVVGLILVLVAIAYLRRTNVRGSAISRW